MSTKAVRKTGAWRKGDVRGIRELSRGIQAEVCLGASTQHGYASITIASHSPKVMAAVDGLRTALREEAQDLLTRVAEDQAEWEQR